MDDRIEPNSQAGESGVNESAVGRRRDLDAPIRPISPPMLKRKVRDESIDPGRNTKQRARGNAVTVSSPFHLTRVADLPDASNVETVTLHDLVGDDQISESWQFSYLFDIDWLMSKFHADIRNVVKVKVVHGSWKREDTNGQRIKDACGRWSNVEEIKAYMPDPFGTHHTKMIILFRTDDTAQVVITTANTIAIDWGNMTQAVWKSPRLPRLPEESGSEVKESSNAPCGSGARFKQDLLNYLKAYGSGRTRDLTGQLEQYDFSDIKAALVGSVPTRQKAATKAGLGETLWGWQGLREVLRSIPKVAAPSHASRPRVIVQVSSIASLGQTDDWLANFLQALAGSTSLMERAPHYRIVFPSADEIRRSIGGYDSGASVHAPNNTTPQQQKQLYYLRSKMCYWAGDGAISDDGLKRPIREAGRRRAAPHIKTYMRFTDDNMQEMDWAMITSANLSKQAWGQIASTEGEVRIQSWELGVVVWPELFMSAEIERQSAPATLQKSRMVPTFKTNTPVAVNEGEVTVGLRMPYDLPLVPYQMGEKPWCNKVPHEEPDWMGKIWEGRT